MVYSRPRVRCRPTFSSRSAVGAPFPPNQSTKRTPPHTLKRYVIPYVCTFFLNRYFCHFHWTNQREDAAAYVKKRYVMSYSCTSFKQIRYFCRSSERICEEDAAKGTSCRTVVRRLLNKPAIFAASFEPINAIFVFIGSRSYWWKRTLPRMLTRCVIP